MWFYETIWSTLYFVLNWNNFFLAQDIQTGITFVENPQTEQLSFNVNASDVCQEVAGSNLGQDTDYSDEVLACYSPLLQNNVDLIA
jgi:hypothetical protein